MVGDLVIEKCENPALAEELSALGAITFREGFGHMYKPEDLELFFRDKHSVEIYRRLLADPEFGIWMARDAAGDPAAYLVAGPCDLPVPDLPDNSGEVMRFYARKACYGSGIGGALMTAALAWMDARFDQIYLSVYAKNFGAQRLYGRYGFEKIHEYFYMVGNQADPEFILKRTRKEPANS